MTVLNPAVGTYRVSLKNTDATVAYQDGITTDPIKTWVATSGSLEVTSVGGKFKYTLKNCTLAPNTVESTGSAGTATVNGSLQQ